MEEADKDKLNAMKSTKAGVQAFCTRPGTGMEVYPRTSSAEKC